MTAAQELRAVSRLTPQQLAQVFGVSRTTFYNWMEGATPREEAFTHLMETLNHIKDAKKKLDGIVDLSTWLRTPIAAGEKSPLQYIKEQQFSVFRGLVVRARSLMSGFSQVKAPTIQPSMSAFERRLTRERLSPPAILEDCVMHRMNGIWHYFECLDCAEQVCVDVRRQTCKPNMTLACPCCSSLMTCESTCEADTDGYKPTKTESTPYESV